MKHGHATRGEKTRTYRIWKNMRARCARSVDAHNYFDRGIRVAPRWDDYSAFLADMGECPSGLTLDRINNDGNYEPGNCRWATRAVQSRNNRRNIWVTLRGEEMVLKDAAVLLGVTDTALINIVKRRGITHQQAVDRLINGVPQRVRGADGTYLASL